MIEITGNFWDVAPEYDLLVIPTNGVVTGDNKLVMGAGLAKAFRDSYPGIDKKFGQYLQSHDIYYRDYQDIRYYGCLLDVEQGVAALQTKYHWKKDSCYDLIDWSVKLLAFQVNAYQFKKVLMTRPGCGLGNLIWPDVRKAIEDTLDDRFTVINKVV